MKSRGSWLPVLLFASLAVAAGAWGYHEQRELAFLRGRMELLESDNARLQNAVGEQKKSLSSADEVAKRKSIEEAVVSIRGLDFIHPVTYDVLPRAGFKKILEGKMSEQYSDQDFKNYAAGLAALGLLEPGYPLKEKYISLLGEQVAAFYDQHQHKLFMFEDASLTNSQNCIILSHELTHALQDQHFNLLSLPLEVKNDDDLALATSALIEGDATVVMSDYMMKNMTLKMVREDFSGMYSQNMDQIKNAPLYLREMLMFPYVRGQEFCTVLSQRGGGYEAISNAFRNPPASTTQILHPAKYFAHEMPIRIEWTDTTVSGKKPVDDNVLGEFGTRILFTQWLDATTGQTAAEGWRGDRYLVYGDGEGLVWKSLWIDEAHALRFRDALQSYVTRRFKQCTVVEGDSGNVLFFSSPACTGTISRAKTQNGIIFIWATTKEMNEALVKKFGE